jgi:hypothetical protein
MTISRGSFSSGGRKTTMARFELDRLFGLALTDARFYNQLRDRPHHAISQFQLTEPETEAVISIAPTTNSIQELALRLDSWMTGTAKSTVAEQSLHPIALGDQVGLDSHHQKSHYTRTHHSLTHQDNEQGLCLTLSESIARS